MSRIIICLLVNLLYPMCLWGQNFDCIPKGKHDAYKDEFFRECRNAERELPYSIKINNGKIDMKKGFIVLDLPFVLDCDTTQQYYMTNPIYDYYMDSDSLVLRQDSYRTVFDFDAVGCFDYKDFFVVVYTFPLANPNYYVSLTINTYTKEGIRIDRLPFFIWRYDLSILEWGENLDESWIEQTGYIDESFEITIRRRTPWEEFHEDHGFCKEGLDDGAYNYLHEYVEYHVYSISDDGHFVEVQKKHKYEVDERNNWAPTKQTNFTKQ